MSAVERIAYEQPTLVNLDAEQAFLGSLLYRNEVLDMLDVTLEPGHFAEKVNARIFEAAVTMIRSGRRADAVTLNTYFKADSALADIGGTAYLARLAASAITLVAAPGYASLIHDLYLRRQAVDRAQSAIDELYNLPVDQRPADYLATLAHEFAAMAEEQGRGEKTTFTAAAATTLSLDCAAEAYQHKGKLPGSIETGIDGLDEKINGLVRGNMIVIGARPSMGKSALALTLACNAGRRGNPVLFISLEMRAKELADRMISMAARSMRRLPYERIARGRFGEEDYQILIKAKAEADTWKVTIEDRSAPSLAAIRSAIARQKARNPSLGVVIVDYLGQIALSNRYAGHKVDEIGEISTGLKQIAKQLDVCMIVAHQLNRSLEGRDNKRPTMADLRDSGAIEQDADIIIFPFREAYYVSRALEAAEPQSADEVKLGDRLSKVVNEIDLIVAKNRHGSTGTVHAWCDIGCNAIGSTAPEPVPEGLL